MAGFRFEEEKSNIISGYDIMCKSNEESFEDMIKQFKECTPEQVINAGTNAFIEVVNDFQTIWDDDQQVTLQALFAFVEYAINIGCTDMKEVPEAKKDVIGKFFLPLGERTAKALRNGERFFNPSEFTEEDYQEVIEVFLCASLKPLMSPYPFKLYRFIMACAVADSVNEPGLDKVRKLRKDYLAFVRKKELAGEIPD